MKETRSEEGGAQIRRKGLVKRGVSDGRWSLSCFANAIVNFIFSLEILTQCIFFSHICIKFAHQTNRPRAPTSKNPLNRPTDDDP